MEVQSFADLPLSTPIKRAVAEMGFEVPSPIQAQTLPILLEQDTDFLGLAATGTGKTAAFGIPLLEKIDPTVRGIQALILCPTRELAVQVSGQIELLGKHKNIHVLPVYGGVAYNDQIRGIKQGASIIVGTPGRVIDHIEHGYIKLDNLKHLVLDEADEMISMGFKDELETILGSVPEDQARTWLFSATMGSEVSRVVSKYLKDPQQVQVNRTEMLSSTVEQIFYATQESNKPEVLCKIIDAADDFYGIVFCQTKSLVVDLNRYLLSRGYLSDAIQGDMLQGARERTMNAFRERKFNILVATDVACRGLDVKDITHIVNYSIPRELDNYVHRIGRTARGGKTGVAISLVTNSHRNLITRIERMTKSKIKEGTIPTRKEIGTKKVLKSLERFQEQSNFARAVDLLDDNWHSVLDQMSKEEITGRFITLLFPDLFASEKQMQMSDSRMASEPNRRDERRERSGGRRDRDGRDDRREGRRRRFDDDQPVDVASLPKPRSTPAEAKAVAYAYADTEADVAETIKEPKLPYSNGEADFHEVDEAVEHSDQSATLLDQVAALGQSQDIEPSQELETDDTHKPKFNRERRERAGFGSDRRESFGGERGASRARRESFGGERREGFGGERRSRFGGDRRDSFGDRPSFGARRERSDERRPAFGERRSSFGDRRERFGDRHEEAPKRKLRGARPAGSTASHGKDRFSTSPFEQKKNRFQRRKEQFGSRPRKGDSKSRH